MTKVEIKNNLVSILYEIFNIVPEQIKESFLFFDFEEWDSLKQIRLIVALENEFGINFNQHELIELTDSEKLINVIYDKIT